MTDEPATTTSNTGQHFHPDKTETRLWETIFVFALFALSVAFAGKYVFHIYKEKIKQSTQSELSGIAWLKTEQITEWLAEREGNALSLRDDPNFQSDLDLWLQQGGPDGALKARLSRRITALQQSKADYGCTAIAFFDEHSRLRFTTSPQQLTGFDKNLMQQSMHGREVLQSDIHVEKRNGEDSLEINFFVPLRSGDRLLGTVLFSIDPLHYLFPIIQSWPTASPSAESLLVRREGGEVVFLNELRHRKNKAMAQRLPLTRKDLPAAMAALGVEGMVEGVDYRDVPVVGVINSVPGTSWKMVSKIDQAEIYAPIDSLSNWIELLMLTFVAIGAAVTLFWRKKQFQLIDVLQRQHEQELHQRGLTRRLDHLTRYANDIILLVGETGKVLEFNDRALEAYGYTADEMSQLTLFDLRRDPQQQVLADMRRVQEAGAMRFEVMHSRKDGSRFPVEVSVRMVHIDGKRCQQAIIRDITERRRTEAELKRQQDFIRQVIDSDPNLIFVKDAEGRFLLANQAMAKSYGHTTESIIGKHNWELTDRPDLVAEYDRENKAVLESGKELVVQNKAVLADGRVHTLRTLRKPLVLEDGTVNLLTIATDITELKKAEQGLRRLNRALKLLSDCNAASMQIDDEQHLLEEICKLAVETGDYRMAWIATANQDEGHLIRPAARYGNDGGYLDQVAISFTDTAEGQGPTGLAFRTGKTQVNPDFETNPQVLPWRDAALAHGYHSSIAVPLRNNDETLGVLTIYAAEADAFSRNEVRLLEELGDNLAFGITANRAIAGRTQAMERLRQSEERFRFLTENATDVVFLLNIPSGRYDYISPASARMCGYTPEELFPFSVPDLIGSLIHPDSRVAAAQMWELFLAGEIPPYVEYRITHKSGEMRWLGQRNTPIHDASDDGKLVAVQGIITDITERKQVEIQLERERMLLRTLVQTIPDLIWLKDPEGVYLSCNPQFERFFGAKEAEIIGKTDYDFIDKGLADFFRQKDLDAITADKPCLNEEWITYPDGQHALLETIKTPMHDETGQLIGVMGIARDITEIERAAARESRLLRILDDTQDMIFMFRPDTLRFVYMNRGALDNIGFSLDELLQMTPADLNPRMPEDELRRFIAPLQVDEHRVQRFESLIRCKNGNDLPVEVQLQLVQETSGEKLYVAIVRDITERKHAEWELQRQRAFMLQVIDTDPNRVLVKDAKGYILLANRSMAAAHGLNPEQIVGRNIATIGLCEEVVSAYLEGDREVIAEGRDISRLDSVTLPDGNQGWLLTLKKRLVMPNGMPCVLSIQVDITQQKLSEFKLAESYKELQQLSLHLENARADERSRIALNLHDEMGATLAAIKMGIAWLTSRLPAEPPQLRNEAAHINELVSDGIHTMHHIVTQLRPNLLGDVGLSSAITDYVRKYRQHTSIECFLDMPKEEIVLTAEQSLTVFRILQESLNNVFKHSQADRVEIMLAQRDDALMVVVRDNGVGFEPSTRKEHSFGLLGIRERALMVGGKARIYSKPGKGTRVSVTIPLAVPRGERASSPVFAPSPTSNANEGAES